MGGEHRLGRQDSERAGFFPAGTAGGVPRTPDPSPRPPPRPRAPPPQLGPLRSIPGVAEQAGCASAAGLVLILTACLAAYGATTFQGPPPAIGVKTLSGRDVRRDPLQSAEGWSNFTAGWLVGGLSGVAWAYVLTQILPY